MYITDSAKVFISLAKIISVVPVKAQNLVESNLAAAFLGS